MSKFLDFVQPAFAEIEMDEDIAAWDAQRKADEEDRAKRRKAFYAEWVRPENIAARYAQYEADKEAALEAGKKLRERIRTELGLPLEDLPVPDPLPDRMKGQSPATIQMMLRQEKIWFNKLTGQWVTEK